MTRSRRRVRTAGVAALASLLAYVLIGLPFFVFPDTEALPRHADVALALGDPTPQRTALALHLLRHGVVDDVLLSVPFVPSAATPRTPPAMRACGSSPRIVCFRPDPFTTQGEARELRAAAAAHGWTSAIVITQTAHIDRARLIVGRCFAGRITMRASGEPPQHSWLWQYPYQTIATVKAVVGTTGC